jgi:hypothetical protein
MSITKAYCPVYRVFSIRTQERPNERVQAISEATIQVLLKEGLKK